jgi:membrane associated rhomboid family serine protease
VNNLTLYFFGTTCAAVLGPTGFLTLYVAGGIFSSLW